MAATTRRAGDDWNPLDPSVRADQRQAYDELRERCPVAYSDFMGWSVFRWADVVRVIDDPITFSNVSRHPAIPNGMDPPIHTRYRAALLPSFSEPSLQRTASRLGEIARELVDSLRAAGEVELVQTFAEPAALRGLCAFLGWPESQWEALGGWTHGNQQAALTRDRSAARALAVLLAEHVARNLEGHRRHGPEQDVSDRLLAVRVDGRSPSDEELVAIVRNWIAGEGTVAGAIATVVARLAADPELQERLRREPAQLPEAIEEILRIDGPLVANRRTATRETEIGNRRIEAGATVSLMWIAANRDPEAFDEAELVRLDRDQSRNLIWGRGIHLCLGAPLARLQIRTALEQLLATTTSIETIQPPRRAVYPSDAPAELWIRLR